MEREEGQIYTYKPASTWCRHGILVIRKANRLFASDTYWFDWEHGFALEELEAGRAPELKFTGLNFNDFEKVGEYDYDQRKPEDVFYIPRGSYDPMYLIRKGSQPDPHYVINQQNEIIRTAEAEISSAEWRKKKAEQEIEKWK